MTKHRAQRLAVWVLLALPAFLAFNFVYRFGVNVLSGDDWELVPLIDKWFAGGVSFDELFAQHNEHRFFFPRLVMLLSASALDFNSHALMFMSWLLMLLVAALLFAEHRSTFGKSSASMLQWVPIAWLLFSARQYENWLWGWQIGFFMCVVSFVAAAMLLQTSDRGAWRFPLAVGCAVVSTYTVGGGLGVWPAGVAQLIVLHFLRRKALGNKHLIHLGLWCAVAALAAGLYVRGLRSNPAHPDPAYVAHHPLEGLRFFVAALGGPFSHFVDGALAAGTVLCVVGIAVLVVWRKGDLDLNRASFAVPFCVFGATFVALITIGRGGWGPASGLSSRYTTLIALFAVGVHRAASSVRTERLRAALGGVLVCMTVSCLAAFFQESYALGFQSKDYHRTNAELLRDWRNRSDEELRRLYPAPAVVRERAPIMERHRINVFAK